MDLGLFARVLWRQKYLVAAGILVALAVSTLAGYTVTSKGLAPRAEPTYTSVASIFVVGEQGGAFRAVTPKGQDDSAKSREDPGQLADVYAQLVVSDQVKRRVEQVFGPMDARKARITAFRQVARTPGPPVAAGRTRPLPFIEIDAMAPNPGTARKLANLTAGTFLRYVDEQQVTSGIPPEQRVSLMLARDGTSGKLTSKSPLSLVFLLFVGFLTCFIALAAILHNVAERRRRRPDGAATTVDQPEGDVVLASDRRYSELVVPTPPPRVDRLTPGPGAGPRPGPVPAGLPPIVVSPGPVPGPMVQGASPPPEPPAPPAPAPAPAAERQPEPVADAPSERQEPDEAARDGGAEPEPEAPAAEEQAEPAFDGRPAPEPEPEATPAVADEPEEPAAPPPDRQPQPASKASRPASAIPWWQITTVPTVEEPRPPGSSVSTGGQDRRGEDLGPEEW